ncbi:MAG: porin family protein [Mediterranea sp.]|nr:porin family protein [Mediterranea sp.]
MKLFLVIAVATLSTNVLSAQEKGDMAVGGNLSMGTGNGVTNFGIGAKYQYNVTDPIRLEGSFNYFLKKNYTTLWDLTAYGHWLFPVAQKVTVYPVVGLGIVGASSKYKLEGVPNGYGQYVNVDGGTSSSSNTEFGFTFGGGVDYQLTDRLTGNAELKYKIAGLWDRFMFSVGVNYRF